MNKRGLAWAELILQIVAIVLLFIPGFMTRRELFYVSGVSPYWHESFYYMVGSYYDLWTICVPLLMLVNIIFGLLCLIRKKQMNKIVHGIITVVPIVFIFIFVYDITNTLHSGYSFVWYSPNWLFYVELFVLILIIVLATIRSYGHFAENKQKHSSKNQEDDAVVSELTKYKSLLDRDIISPAEFDAIKRKLLSGVLPANFVSRQSNYPNSGQY